MELLKEDLQTLIDLGLTLLQAKVYLALVKGGTMSVKMIANSSKVARPDIYRIISLLKQKGLVETELGKPSKYTATPIDVGLKTLFNIQKRDFEKLKTKVTLLNKKFIKSTNEKSTESKFTIIPCEELIIQRLKKSIARTQKTIDVMTSSNRLTKACYFLSNELGDAWERGVIGRAIINFTNENEKEIIEECWKKPNAKICYMENIPKTVIAKYDDKEVFIFTNPNSDLKQSPALWSNCPSIIYITRKYFDLMWKKV